MTTSTLWTEWNTWLIESNWEFSFDSGILVPIRLFLLCLSEINQTVLRNTRSYARMDAVFGADYHGSFIWHPCLLTVTRMSFQSTLNEDEGVAERLADDQRSISISEFLDKNKQMLGFDKKSRAVVTAIKEAVDNSLDAAEEAEFLPSISVEIEREGEYYTVIVEDNGPGITKEQIPKIFGKLLYGSRFHKREQARGQQGIGISAAVLYSQQTSGRPAKVTSKTPAQDNARYFEVRVNTDDNKPEIQAERELEWNDKEHGTRIELQMAGNMRARQQLHNYIRHTSVVNPHAELYFDEPGIDEPMHFERASDELPDPTEEIPPHPHGVELGALKSMLETTDSYSLSGFLQDEFTRVGQKTADNIINNFRDRYFGREMRWKPPEDRDKLVDAVISVVNNKGKEDTRKYAELIAEYVYDDDRVSYSEVQDAVNTAAEEAVEEFGRSFGSTVRSKSSDVAWEAIVEECSLHDVVDEATSKRKDDDAVEVLARTLTESVLEANGKNRITPGELENLVADAADKAENEHDETFGEKSRGKVYDAVWDLMMTVDDGIPNVGSLADDRDDVSALQEAMLETNVIAPPSDCLSPITEPEIERGLKQFYDAEFYASETRNADSYSGDPFIAEAGIAYGGELQEGQADLLRFANRVPLVYQRGACSITDVVKNIGWRNYKLDQTGGHGIPEGPVVIMVHIASTNVPFTSESKDALANVEVIEKEIERAIRGAARELKSHLQTQQNLEERRERQSVVARVLPEISEKAASVVGGEPADVTGALAQIMNSVQLERDEESLTIANYTDREQFTFHLDFERKPTYPSQNVEREETEEGWRLVWEGSLEQGESEEITWNLDEPEDPEVSSPELARERIVRGD